MQSTQEIERIFQMRQEFKECKEPREEDSTQPSPKCAEESNRITELIDKIKN